MKGEAATNLYGVDDCVPTEDSRAVASEFRNKFLLVQDALTLHRSEGALVRVTAQVQPGDARAEEIASFIRALFPVLTKHLPE